MHQTSDGYVATVLAGEMIAENGLPTAARPGRLVCGRQPEPA
jgi:N-acyl-D-aspartate/D-glutamate deacylase